VLGLPLGQTDNKVATVMVNLVGAPGYSGPVVYEGIEQILELPGVSPHIYGKRETRPFRKMGHVTIADASLDRARETAARVKETIQVRSNSQKT
jgi:5-(carboxyamino)imidazole ribonucleotide synthase